MHEPRDKETATIAAQITIAVMQAALGIANPPGGEGWVRLGNSIGLKAVIDALAHTPKPVECSASWQGTFLQISCSPIRAGTRWLYNHAIRQIDTGHGPIGLLLSSTRPQDSILVITPFDRLSISARELEFWRRTYIIGLPFGLSVKFPDGISPDGDDCPILSIGHVAGAGIELF